MYKVILTVLSSAFVLCLWLLPVLEKLAKKKGLITHESPEKIDKRKIPYIGGAGMFMVFFAVCLGAYLTASLAINPRQLYLFLLVSAIIFFFGFYDDVKELKPTQKLIGQSIGAVIFITFAMKTQIIYFNSFVNIVLSVFWIVVMINAFNLLDILDGLAGSISIINIFVFFLFGIFTNNNFVILIAACLCGVLFAFLRYNLPPARIFMGDAGSQFLGFAQAMMAISLSFAPSGREVGLVIPLVILAIPLFDLLFVMFMRFRQKKSIFLKSNDHFVFKMLQFGISRQTILRIMIIMSALTNSCALIIFLVSNIFGAIIFCLVISVLVLFGVRLSRLEISQ
ncbi:MAG: MraY family glycosyltransferase [Candidatus Omnitrophota bacterium]